MLPTLPQTRNEAFGTAIAASNTKAGGEHLLSVCCLHILLLISAYALGRHRIMHVHDNNYLRIGHYIKFNQLRCN